MRAQTDTPCFLSIVALPCAAFALASLAPAQQLVRSVNGPGAGMQYGKACVVVPDQNGDGYKDLLVGVPGFNQQRGEIVCLSGAFLASGVGAQTLWAAAPASGAAGDAFGTSLAVVGDVVGSSAPEFAVGAPGYGSGGAIYVVDGFAHTVFAALTVGTAGSELGASLAGVSDINGDGRRELAIGAPGAGTVLVVSGIQLPFGGTLSSQVLIAISAGSRFGTSIASGFDLDGDGYDEIAVGAPLADPNSATDAGLLYFISTAPNSPALPPYNAAVPGEHLGASVDAARDYDGDGVVDIVVGAPNATGGTTFELGRVVVLSGARILAHTPPYEIFSLAPPAGFAGNFHFGAAVRACDDLTHDGLGEILVGMPDFASAFGPGKGAVQIFSGASGVQIESIFGVNNDKLGDAIAGAIGDLDGDGFKDFVLAGSLSDAGGTDSGVVKCYRLFPVAPSTYCTGKVNSLGCTPAIAFSGSPSETSGLPFLITGSNFLNQKNGLLFYSHRSASAPFQGGFKCVHAPFVRAPGQNSGGAASGSDCSGVYTFDFNDWITNGSDGSLGAGSEMCAQYWSRDPASASHTSLSNAVRFVINP